MDTRIEQCVCVHFLINLRCVVLSWLSTRKIFLEPYLQSFHACKWYYIAGNALKESMLARFEVLNLFFDSIKYSFMKTLGAAGQWRCPPRIHHLSSWFGWSGCSPAALTQRIVPLAPKVQKMWEGGRGEFTLWGNVSSSSAKWTPLMRLCPVLGDTMFVFYHMGYQHIDCQCIFYSRRMSSSVMLRRVDLLRTDVSGEGIAFIIRETRIGELRTTLAVTNNRSTLRKNIIVYLRGVPLTLFLARRFLLLRWWSRFAPPKLRFFQERYGIISQKTAFFIVTAVKTSYLTQY
jgi:hypothetical protein